MEPERAPLPFRGPVGAALADESLVIAGTIQSREAPDALVGLARFTRDLALDTGFGGGLVVGPEGFVIDLVLQADGAPVVAAGRTTGQADTVLRLTPDGRLDESFGEHGSVVPLADASATVMRLVAQADGRVLVAGLAGGNLVLVRLLGTLVRRIRPRPSPVRAPPRRWRPLRAPPRPRPAVEAGTPPPRRRCRAPAGRVTTAIRVPPTAATARSASTSPRVGRTPSPVCAPT
jgi:hypothetical protein